MEADMRDKQCIVGEIFMQNSPMFTYYIQAVQAAQL
jgi:hypothetical protein